MILHGFDSDKFSSYLKELINKNNRKIDSINKKGINFSECDPFSALFECATLGITMSEWCSTYEAQRQKQKTLQNHIGKLHEIAISCLPGWEESNSTADVENSSLKIIAEVKNKHNTMNSSSALSTYRKLEQLVDGVYEGYQSYVVQILPQHSAKPYEVSFTPSDSSKKKAKKCSERDDIKLIDGESFYAMANGNVPGTMKAIYELMSDILISNLGSRAETVTNEKSFETFIQAVLPSLRTK